MKSGGGESSALFAQTRTACAGKDDENPQKSLGLLGECGSFPSFQSSEPTSARTNLVHNKPSWPRGDQQSVIVAARTIHRTLCIVCGGAKMATCGGGGGGG